MNIRIHFLSACFCASVVAQAQIDSINQRIFLVGDPGQPNASGNIPVLDWLKRNVDWTDEKNVFLFLGDNIYPDGLPSKGDPDYDAAKFAIDYQINMIRGTKAKAYFVPGNHDWKGGKMGGWQRVMNQVDYINSLQQPNIQAWPLNGCPGPVPVELNDKVVLVFIDSQWFLHIHEKPGPESACESRTIDEFSAELKQIADMHPNQLLMVVTHHALQTYGLHGGAYTWKSNIFPFTDAIPWLYIPLPVLGSVYPLARGVFGSLQDTYHPLYKTMIATIEDVMKTHPNPVSIAGHEHSLQLIMKDSIPYIVSGSASKLTRLRKGKNSLFSILEYGFAILEVRKSGKTEVKYYTLRSPNLGEPLFSYFLKTITKTTPPPSLDTLKSIPPLVITAAAENMKDNAWRRFFFGKNYRSEWKQPIKIPVFDLRKESGGLKPLRQDGGNWAKELNLEDKSGKIWTLRSIEAFPQTAIPSDLRPVSRRISQNAVSGTYPYAVFSVSPLIQAAEMTDIRRRLVYVPDDPRLERFRVDFKNTIAILEEREPGNIKKTDNTNDVVLNLTKTNVNRVDQAKVLKARLLDNFVMDFDRHDNQWRWGYYEKDGQKIYYPISRDHAQAFFTNQGIIPSFLRRSWFMPEIQGFSVRPKNVKTFNKVARNFDRSFLHQLSEGQWSQLIDTFLISMTDSVISAAFARQPDETQAFSAPKLASILKQKRKFFKTDMLEYYRFISKIVSIPGSDERDFFDVSANTDGKIRVVVTGMDTSGKLLRVNYERVFDPAITKEIRLYGQAQADSFVLRNNLSAIKIRIVGGGGNDHFISQNIRGTVLVYDVTFEENKFTGGGITNKITSIPENNIYNRLEYKYNTVKPIFIAEVNAAQGLQLSQRTIITLQGFRKEPFASRQYVEGRYTPKTGSYYIEYFGEFTTVFRNNDLVIKAGFGEPVNISNYFGTGNNIKITASNPGDFKYYRTTVDAREFSLLLRRQLQSWMRFNGGAAYRYYHIQAGANAGRFVSSTVSSADSAKFYKPKSFIGPEFLLDINSKNSPLLPTRGAAISSYVRSLFGLTPGAFNTTQLGIDLSIFMSLAPETKTVFAIRFGAGHNIGKFEFPQAQYLSGTKNLRGYMLNRFAGRTMFFNNAELRYKLIDFKSYLFEGSAGFLIFHDIGRVWSENEQSKKWHSGYGGGVWVSPIKRVVLVGSLAFSKEESALPLVTFGFQF